MIAFAEITLGGNLTADSKIGSTNSGQAVLHFTVAANRRFKTNGEMKEETTFAPVEVYGKQVEMLSKKLSKGQNVVVLGVLRGDARSGLRVFAKSVHFKNGVKAALPEKEQESEVVEEPQKEEVVKEGVAA